jgi:hypothetical protein
VLPQCGQPTDVETDATNTQPHEQRYEAVSSGPPAARSRANGAGAGVVAERGSEAGGRASAAVRLARRPKRGRERVRWGRVCTVIS